jgi:hypothetical protein
MKVAHFELTADLQKLIESNAFVEMVAAFAQAQGNNLVVLDHAELAAVVRANSTMFKGATFIVDQFVGVDDGFIHQVAMQLDAPIDPTVGGYDDEAFHVNWALNIKFSAINKPITITEPEGARVVSAFGFPSQAPLQAPTEGTTQYAFFADVSENGYSQVFEAKAGDIVTLTARGLGLDYDAHLALSGPDYLTVAENDDHEGKRFGVNDPDPQIVDFKIPKDGRYQVIVTEVNGAAGSFLLTITVHR